MKKILLMTLGMICLESCQSPQSFKGDQYSVEDGRCFKRGYEVSETIVGATSKFKEVDSSECKKIIGYKPKDYAALWALMDYVRGEIPEKTRIVNEAGYEN